METTSVLTKAILACPNEPSLFFFRGLLYFQLHRFYESVQDLSRAINLEPEATPLFYLARGRAFACMSVLTEAVKDLSFALKLDESLMQAYHFRGQCAY